MARLLQHGYLLFIFAFCIVLGGLSALGGCSDGGSSTATDGGTPPAGGSPTPPPGGPSSMDVINAAEAAGKITHDTALLYLLYALHDPTELPPEYRGDDSGLYINSTTILGEIRQRLDVMPADLQAKFRPFFLRPTNPLSVWQKHAKATASLRQKLAGEYSDFPWKYVDCTKTPVRVWYVGYSFMPEFEKAAKDLAAEIDGSDMWWKERVAMLGDQPCSDAKYPKDMDNGGDGKLDIYLITQTSVRNNNDWDKALSAAGITIPEWLGTDGCAISTVIMINPLLPSENMKVTAAHELFHAFQYALVPMSKNVPDYFWWMEASATWAEDLVYPATDFEQSLLKQGKWAYNDTPNGPLDYWEKGSQRQYAAYIWPFYLSHRPGGTPEIVGNIWKNSLNMTPLQSMAQLLDFPTAFREFALWNWNKPPVQKYSDHGAPIPEYLLSQNTKDITAGMGLSSSKSPYTMDISLEKVSIQYWRLPGTSQDTDIKKLRFDLAGLRGRKGAGIQAIITLGVPGSPRYRQFTEDWSDRDERAFCLATENVTDVILAVSNSDITTSLTGKIRLEALTDGCTAWVGTTTTTVAYLGPVGVAGSAWDTCTAQVTFRQKAQTLGYLEYEVEKGTLTCSLSGTYGECTFAGGPVTFTLGPADGGFKIFTDIVPEQYNSYNGLGTYAAWGTQTVTCGGQSNTSPKYWAVPWFYPDAPSSPVHFLSADGSTMSGKTTLGEGGSSGTNEWNFTRQ